MTDEQFLTQFAALTLDPAEFGHSLATCAWPRSRCRPTMSTAPSRAPA
ncbi:hypothetical protein LP419_00540 [Massilia sp. H-1]|nr:hypothetical protein LP419_00540 [Massilia sp. H-1]